MADKRKSIEKRGRAKKGKAKPADQESVKPSPEPEDNDKNDYGGMNLSNFKRNLGCGG
jgi:hypothetical protein